MVFMCSQERIDNLPFHKPSSKVQKAEAVVAIDGVLVVRLADGRFITSARDAHKWAYPISADKVFREPIIRGLQKIGAITKAEADAHMAEHRKAKAARERKWAEKMLMEHAANLGIAAQVAQAMEARQGGDAKQAPSPDDSAVHAPTPIQEQTNDHNR